MPPKFLAVVIFLQSSEFGGIHVSISMRLIDDRSTGFWMELHAPNRFTSNPHPCILAMSSRNDEAGTGWEAGDFILMREQTLPNGRQ